MKKLRRLLRHLFPPKLNSDDLKWPLRQAGLPAPPAPTAVFTALLNDAWSQVVSMAQQAAQRAPTHPERALFSGLAAYARANEIWDTSWDFTEAIELMQQALQQVGSARHLPVGEALYGLFTSDLESCLCEQEWSRYELTQALRHSQNSEQHSAQLLHRLRNKPEKEKKAWENLFQDLIEQRWLYQQGVTRYLQAYKEILSGTVPNLATSVQATTALEEISHRLRSHGALDDAQEIDALNASLQRRLIMSRERARGIQLYGLRFSWTFRRGFPQTAIDALREFCASKGEASCKERLETATGLPVLYTSQALLNDVFTVDVGKENFTYLAIDLGEPFAITLEFLPHPLKIHTEMRFYSGGVVSIQFAIAPSEEMWTVSQVQMLRLAGSPQSPGFPLRAEWLPEGKFNRLSEVAPAILGRMQPLLETLTTEETQGEEITTFYKRLQTGKSEAWSSYALIQVDRLEMPPTLLETFHACELAALSQPLLESQDSLEAWTRLQYDPKSNIAREIKSYNKDALLFTSNDHVFLYLPEVAGWVQQEMLDLIEFTLNVATLVREYLHDVRLEVKALHAFSHAVKAIMNTGQLEDLQKFITTHLTDVVRLNTLRSQLLMLQNLVDSSQVTHFAEHRVLLESIVSSLNLRGMITQAENLVTAVLDVQQHLDTVGRLVQARVEERRARWEKWLSYFVEVLGISSVVSAFISILTLQDDTILTIPWFGQLTGKTAKEDSLLLMAFAVLLMISVHTFLGPVRRKGQ